MANMLFANNCNTTLNGGITAIATSMVVTSATGFPAPTGSQYFYCTLADAATQTTIEIVKVTAVSGTTFTIVRGQDGTTGTIFASGAVVSLRLVRANLNDFPKLDEDNTFAGTITFSTPLLATNMVQSTTSTSGYLSSTDWNTFNNKSNTNGTVTSVAALTLGTTGTDLSSTVANGTTTPVITLQVPTASATNRGALSSTDWSTFNGKQAALVSGTNIKTVSGTSLLGSGDVGTIGTSYGGTGLTSFTANGVMYASSTSALATGSALNFDGTYLLLGTTSQSANTTAKQTIASSGSTQPALQWRGSDTNWWGRLSNSVGGATIASFISSAGNWSVSGNTFSVTKDFSGAFSSMAIMTAAQYNAGTARISFLHKSGGATTTDGAVTELGYFDPSGNLSVTGTATASSFIPTSSTVPTNGLYLPTTNTLGLATNSAEIARFSAAGNLSIGNTGFWATPSATRKYLGVYGSTDGAVVELGSVTATNGIGVFQINGANGGNYIGLIQCNSNAGSSTAGSLDFFTNSGSGLSNRLSLASTGVVTMGAYGAGAATFSAAGVISSVSDETWKTKDGVPTNPDEMLQKLEPGYWYYNEEKAPIFGTERQLGFYAQNVNEAIGNEAAPIPGTFIVKAEDGTETSVTKPWGYYDRSVLAVTVMSLKNALNTIQEMQVQIANLTKGNL